MGKFKNWRYYLNKILSVPLYIKITGAFILIIIVLEFTTIMSIYLIFYKHDQQHLKESGKQTGKIIADMAEDYVEANNIRQLKDNLKFEIIHNKILRYIIVKRNDGEIITFVSKNGYKIGQNKKSYNDGIIDLNFPILNDNNSGRFGPIGTRVGTISVGVTWGVSHYFFKIIIIFITFVLLPLLLPMIMVFVWISLFILRPITNLSVAIESAKNKNYAIAVQIPRYTDEKLVKLISEFNNMLIVFNKTGNKWENKDLRRKEFIEEIIKAQEAERKKLARELHDELGQFLIYINMKFHVFENLYDIKQENEHIKEMRFNILKEIDIIKNITKSLKPGVLYELGLYKAIIQHTRELKLNHGMEIEIHTSGDELFKAEEYIEVNIYRIFQEAFSNIIRHSNATFVKVVINYEKCIFKAIIEDNGKGIKSYKIDKNINDNFGISSMKERAEILGGSLYIKTKAGLGTIINLSIPIYDNTKE